MPARPQHYDEMHLPGPVGRGVREHCRPLVEWLAGMPPERVAEKRREADLLFHRVGITFAVYGDEAGAERLIPFDTIPRITSLTPNGPCSPKGSLSASPR